MRRNYGIKKRNKNKDAAYDMYLSLVYETKDYDDISRSKMADAIIKEYAQENYLYYICTQRELEFLKKFKNKDLTDDNISKYKWEIEQLMNKCIISRFDCKVFEEQKDNVNKALKYYENRKIKHEDEIIIMMIGTIRVNGQMLSKTLKSIITSLYKVTEEQIDRLFGHPLFKFYCDFTSKYFEFSDNYEELVSYRQYWDLLDEIEALRQEYGIAGSMSVNINDYSDFFYYGFNISNSKVKKMYDLVNKTVYSRLYLDIIERARLLNDKEILKVLNLDEELLKIIEDALDEIPCAVTNGLSPKQYKKELKKQKEVDKDFIREKQEDAHLTKEEADLYYKLYFALLEYVNDKYNIEKNIKKIYRQNYLNPQNLVSIDKYIWEHREVIDEFIKDNKYNFNKEELEDIKLFKSAETDIMFILVGYEKEYTKILSKEGKLYMVKGVRCNIDEIVGDREIPLTINTTLLMFKNKIIYNGFLSPYEIIVGSSFKEMILKDVDTAIKHYHL